MLIVYTAKTDPLSDEKLFDDYYKNLPEYRKEKTDRLKFKKDKMLSVGVGIILEKALSDAGYNAGELTVEYDGYGKPHICGDDVFFNISHSEKRVLCAVSDKPVGCDVEMIGEYKEELAKRFFHEKEYAFLISLKTNEEKRRAFYEIWTAKESFVKAVGLGLRIPFDSFSVSFDETAKVGQTVTETDYYISRIPLDDGYACFVASPFCSVDKVKEIIL